MERLTVSLGEMELNGNCTVTTSGSIEDLSEYTDADESMSAPIEILAEFLSAVMLKDYERALKYCEIILQYEPNHSTAKEFYPLIKGKISEASSRDSDHLENESDGEDDEASSGEEVLSEEFSSGSNEQSSEQRGSDSDATTASYSSLEDEEATGNIPTGHRPITHPKHDNDFSDNGNNSPTTDSESPTEPVSQRFLPNTF